MKKILVLLFATALLHGCIGQEGIKNENVTVRAKKFTFDGHEFIMFDGFTGHTGFVHDPNCWCMADYD